MHIPELGPAENSDEDESEKGKEGENTEEGRSSQ
jgi:hypothetical protein